MNIYTPDISFLLSYSNASVEESVRRVQATINAVKSAGHHEYKCIERGLFATSRIHEHPAYRNVLTRFREPKLQVLELGCCFGTDARKMILDGLAQQNLIVSDLHDFYWNLGKSVLFQDDISSVNSVFMDFAVPLDVECTARFKNRFDVISAQKILHVLSKEQCICFLRNIFDCLNANNGILFGTCIGGIESSEWELTPTKGMSGRVETPRFRHSKETLEALLVRLGFADVQVSCAARDLPALTDADKERMSGTLLLLFSASKRCTESGCDDDEDAEPGIRAGAPSPPQHGRHEKSMLAAGLE